MYNLSIISRGQFVWSGRRQRGRARRRRIYPKIRIVLRRGIQGFYVSVQTTQLQSLVLTKVWLAEHLISLLVDRPFPALLQYTGEFEESLVFQPQFGHCSFGQAAARGRLDVEGDEVGPKIRLLILYGQDG